MTAENLPIRKVAILGAGAIGAYFAARFFETPGFDTVLLARGERLARLQRQGLVINDQQYDIESIDPRESVGVVDLVIVALKHQHLEEALSHLDPLVGEDTVFLSLMNGLESEAIIGARFGLEKVLYGIVMSLDGQRSGNRVTYSNPGIHYFGKLDNRELDERVRRVQQAFDTAGIHHRTPEDMQRMLWWKFMINVGVNQASAVLGATYGMFRRSPDACALKESLMWEAIALAAAHRVELGQQDIDNWYDVLETVAPEGKTSMLQDIEAGRKTEVEIFAGTAVRLGREKGIPTPVNQSVLNIIRFKEQQAKL